MMLPSFGTTTTTTPRSRAGRRAILFHLFLLATAAVATNHDGSKSGNLLLPWSAAPSAKDEVTVVGHDANINGDVRRVLQEPRYRNNYRGSFQYLIDGGCEGDYPIVQAYCKGTIMVHRTSHSTILCAPLLPADNTEFPGYNGYECTTDACGDSATCGQIFQESGDYQSGVFGEVYFQCDGIDVLDVEGFFVWKAATGSCRGLAGLDGRNVHVLSLAVFCTEQNAFDAGDAYFECLDSSTLFLNGELACGQGKVCGTSACEVEFASMAVVTDLHNMEHCIQSLDGTSEVPAIPAPAPVPRSQGTYTTSFSVEWSMALGSLCSYDYPAVTISCTNGIIDDVVTEFPTTTCTKVNDSEMTCTEDDKIVFVNQYSGVKYTCAAVDELPTTEAVFEEGMISCGIIGSILNYPSIGHKLRLGPLCGSLATGGRYYFIDRYVECNVGNRFTDDEDGFVCYADKPGDDSADVGTVKAVRVYTDFRWANQAAAECYEYVAAPGAVPIPIPSSPRAAPTKAPVAAVAPVAKPSPTKQRPITATPTATTEAPVRPPTKAPEKAPTKAPVRPPTKAPTTTDSPVRLSPAPTEAPVRPPTVAPTRSPSTKAPIRLPTTTNAPTTDTPDRSPPPTMPPTTKFPVRPPPTTTLLSPVAVDDNNNNKAPSAVVPAVVVPVDIGDTGSNNNNGRTTSQAWTMFPSLSSRITMNILAVIALLAM